MIEGLKYKRVLEFMELLKGRKYATITTKMRLQINTK